MKECIRYQYIDKINHSIVIDIVTYYVFILIILLIYIINK